MNNFAEMLKEKQLKVTPQRIAILEELKKNGHSSVDDIFNNIREKIPSISLATVYKNILSLHSVEILKSVKTPNQKQKYEINSNPHIHLFCKICEKLEDFAFDTAKLKEQCEFKSGYTEIENVSVILTGLCSECAKKA